MLTIACGDMQFENGVVQTFFWKNLNVVVTNNGEPKVHFKGSWPTMFKLIEMR